MTQLTQEGFTWGPVVETHVIGPYKIIEYHPTIFDKKGHGTGKHDFTRTQFHPYISGVDTNNSYKTLAGAMVGVVARHFDGPNSSLARYIGKALDEYSSPSISNDGEIIRRT